MQQLQHQTLSFGDFTLDLTRGCLRRGEVEIKLRPKSFEVLKRLVENSGRLVSKDELIETVWPDTAVTDDSLVQCLIEVRRALGDDAHRYVKTVPRRGYIFEAEVIEHGAAGREVIYTEDVEGVSVAVEEEEQEEQQVSRSEVVAARQAASAQLIQSGSRRRKLAVLSILATLGAALMTVAYFVVVPRSFVRSDKASISAPRGAGTIRAIAVLPFTNTSGNPDTEYLSDGISESLINSLSQLPGVKVIARSSSFKYKGREVEPQEVANALGVEGVLTGRVAQRGESLLISVELVDARDQTQVWGEQYNRRASDVLAVLSEISREIAEKLRVRLSPSEQQQLVKRGTTNAEAYQFYLRGRYFWNKRTADGLKKAIEQFQQALDRDPDYARAYVGLADCYLLLEPYAGVPATETLPKASAAAERALRLDDTLAEPHTSSAMVYQNQWQWAEAEQEYKRAISLNPNYATAHHWYSAYHISTGQFDDALREIRRAQELDPLSPVISNQVAWVYLLKNDLNSAVEQCQRIIELDPSNPGAHHFLGSAYLKQRRYEEATAELQKAVELSGRASINLSRLGYCYAVTGRRAEALRILKELEEKYARREALGQQVAEMYAGLGDKEQAFAWLEKGFEQRCGLLQLITTDYSFEDLRSDPRYADLVRRMGLQP